MTARRLRSVLAALMVALFGCDALLDGNDPAPVSLRIQNASTLTFDIVTLATLDSLKTWYDVEPGETTSYVEVSAAYRVASTEVRIGTNTLRLQVIDYVGEEYLERGFYTFLLNVADPQSDSPSLVQVIRRDP